MALGLAQAKALNDARLAALPKELLESEANAVANSGMRQVPMVVTVTVNPSCTFQ